MKGVNSTNNNDDKNNDNNGDDDDDDGDHFNICFRGMKSNKLKTVPLRSSLVIFFFCCCCLISRWRFFFFFVSFLLLFLPTDFVLRFEKKKTKQQNKTKVMNLANDIRPAIQTSRQS